jgi:Pathogenicity locus
MKTLRDLKNVGKATLEDLTLLGIRSVEELALQDATFLFQELERRTRHRQDPCVWDVFASIIHEANSGESTNWWDWTAERKMLQKNGKLKHVF